MTLSAARFQQFCICSITAWTVGWGPIPLGPDNPYEMALMKENDDCGEADLPGSFYYAPPNLEPEYWCAGPTRLLAAVCVPRSGPVPQLPDP